MRSNLLRRSRIIRHWFVPFTIILISVTSLINIYVNHHSSNINKFQLYSNEKLYRKPFPRILCLILTSPKNFLTRTKVVNETWAPRCNQYFFVTEYFPNNMTIEQRNFTKQIPILPIKNITAGYWHLTQKVTSAFLYAYETYLNDFDWFVKADDDTYMIIDHLKLFLSDQNRSEPITFGYNFKVIVKKGYHSGGASYVLSRESLRRFYEAHNDTKSDVCRDDGGSEDVEIAKCLRSQGVYPGKSLDKQNRELFHPLPFGSHFHGSFPDWLYKYAENPLQTRYNCCSDLSISFHYVSPDEQYLMDFLLYRTRLSTNKTILIN